MLEFLSKNIFFKIDVEGNKLHVLNREINLLENGEIEFIQFKFGNVAQAARVLFMILYFLLELINMNYIFLNPIDCFH
jgi:hypothetical protein